MKSTHNDLKVIWDLMNLIQVKSWFNHISQGCIFFCFPPLPVGEGRNIREVDKGKFVQASETCKIYLFFKLLKWGKI